MVAHFPWDLTSLEQLKTLGDFLEECRIGWD